jgi:DNA repair exonuclease SbcCD nuclease subunit
VKYERKNSFKRVFRKLPEERQDQVLQAIQALIDFYESGTKVEGLGLKRLRDDIWEIRSSLKDRILFSFYEDIVSFILVGNHDDVRRYLKSL